MALQAETEAELGGNEQKNKDGDGADEEEEEDPFKILMEKSRKCFC
jgi:hypothetical protein